MSVDGSIADSSIREGFLQSSKQFLLSEDVEGGYEVNESAACLVVQISDPSGLRREDVVELGYRRRVVQGIRFESEN
jgi:hypothetical protein